MPRRQSACPVVSCPASGVGVNGSGYVILDLHRRSVTAYHVTAVSPLPLFGLPFRLLIPLNCGPFIIYSVDISCTYPTGLYLRYSPLIAKVFSQNNPVNLCYPCFWGIVNGSVARPPLADTARLADWTAKSGDGYTAIGLALMPDQVIHIRDCADAPSAWSALERAYLRNSAANRISLKRRLYGTRHDPKDSIRMAPVWPATAVRKRATMHVTALQYITSPSTSMLPSVVFIYLAQFYRNLLALN